MKKPLLQTNNIEYENEKNSHLIRLHIIMSVAIAVTGSAVLWLVLEGIDHLIKFLH